MLAWWDHQVGTYMAQLADGTVVGAYGGQYPTPASLNTALGGVLDAAELDRLAADKALATQVAPPPSRTMSQARFMGRFTEAELTAIYTTAKTAVPVEIWLDKFRMATHIDLDDPLVIDGLAALASAGLLTTARALEILA